MTLRDDLIAAKALIDTPDKWGKGMPSYQNSYSDEPNGPICAMGACNAYAFRSKPGHGRFNSRLYVQLGGALGAALPVGFDNVPDYNDANTTTHADIMALFDRAIEAAS